MATNPAPEPDTDGQRLQVAIARPEDAGRGIARLSRRVFDRLKLREGDPVEIVGGRTTTAIAVDARSEDEGLDLIRLDGLQRANAQVGSGDYVEVRRAEAKPATRVVFAPAQKNLRLGGSAEALRRTFYRRPLIAGDVVATSGHQRSPQSDQRL